MKRMIFASVLAGFLLTGCLEGDYGIKPADPQAWEQEEKAVLPSGVKVAEVAPLDLAKVQEEKVAVLQYTPVEFEGGERVYRLVFEGGYAFQVAEDMKLGVADLQKMVEDRFGKRPVERTLAGELQVNLIVDGQALLLKPAPFKLKVTPAAPFISSAYYLIGNLNDWDAAKAVNFKFSHSGKDVYEDPVFTLRFKAGADCYWKLLVQEGYDGGDPWKGAVGVKTDGDTALEGVLTNENPQAGRLLEAGTYVMVLNMMEYTYSLKKVPDTITDYYVLVGGLTGWSADNTDYALYPVSPVEWCYTASFTGDHNFKFWTEANKGRWELAFGADNEDKKTAGPLVVNGGAITLPDDKVYTVTFDLGTMSWSAKEADGSKSYAQVSLIGDFNGWGGDADLTQICPHNWVGRGVAVGKDGGIKFRADHDWGTNWGAEVNIAECNYGVGVNGGANITIAAGTYDVYLNDITGHFLFRKK